MAALIVGETVATVAATYNVPPKTVRSWLSEARQILRDAFAARSQEQSSEKVRHSGARAHARGHRPP
jgi:transposase-like protein